jgi:hypothetical protein
MACPKRDKTRRQASRLRRNKSFKPWRFPSAFLRFSDAFHRSSAMLNPSRAARV